MDEDEPGFATASVDRRGLLEALRIALVGAVGSPLAVSLHLEPRSLTVSFDHGDVVVSTAVRCDALGTASCHVGSTLLVLLLRRLPTKAVRLEFGDSRLTLRSGRTEASLSAGQAFMEPVEGPEEGVTVVTDDYLRAFRANLALGAVADDQNVVRLTPHEADLRIDFHTFDFAVTDLAVGYGGSLGDREVIVRVGALELLVSRFSQRSPKLTVSTDGRRFVWFRAEDPRRQVTTVARCVMSVGEVRRAEPLLNLDRPVAIAVDARRLRGAIKRLMVVHRNGSTGTFATIRTDGADSSSFLLLLRGWWAAGAESLTASVSGGPAEVSVPVGTLFAALTPIERVATISFGSPRDLVVIEDGARYRCLVRPLANGWEDGPAYQGANTNMPLPKIG